MASLSLRHIYKKYPGGVTAVSDFNLEIKEKELLIFVGPSSTTASSTMSHRRTETSQWCSRTTLCIRT